MAGLWCGVLFFTGAIALPAIFTTPGEVLWRVPGPGWGVSAQGLLSAAHLVVRTETTATLAALAVFTTRWPYLLKALRVLRVPVVLVVILGMTHRYIMLMLETARGYFEARRARMVGNPGGAQRRRMAVSIAAVLLGKSLQLTSDVYEAMQARGFRGTVYTLDEFRMQALDWAVLAGFVILAAGIFCLGRA